MAKFKLSYCHLDLYCEYSSNFFLPRLNLIAGMDLTRSSDCFNSLFCSKYLSFFYSGNLALATSLWVNMELSIICLLCLTQRLPPTSKQISIGIPMPVCLAVVERKPHSLNHVCSELQSSFIILMECTREVVGLHPLLSNSYLLSSCFWVFFVLLKCL